MACERCGTEKSIVEKKCKRQFPILIKGVWKNNGKEVWLGFDNQQLATKYNYGAEKGENNHITWERYVGKTNARGTWEWMTYCLCKKCLKEQ